MTDLLPRTIILFSDLSGSTGLYERLGDAAAHAIISETLACWSEIITRRGGRVVKTMGDGLLAVLPAIEEALEAAEALQRSLDQGAVGRPVSLTGRVALHAGSVIEQDGDVFGDAVNVAARLMALTKPRQILTSGEIASSLPATAHGGLRPLGPTRVKGRTSELELYEWVWEKSMVTKLLGSSVPAGKRSALVVWSAAATARVTVERPRITIGRQSFNDLVVDDPRVSRVHARIELRGGRFVLCDESSNGTHLWRVPGTPAVLRGEESDLKTLGYIGLGDAPRPGEPHTVEYLVETEASGASTTE